MTVTAAEFDRVNGGKEDALLLINAIKEHKKARNQDAKPMAFNKANLGI